MDERSWLHGNADPKPGPMRPEAALRVLGWAITMLVVLLPIGVMLWRVATGPW